MAAAAVPKPEPRGQAAKKVMPLRAPRRLQPRAAIPLRLAVDSALKASWRFTRVVLVLSNLFPLHVHVSSNRRFTVVELQELS